MDSSRTPEEIMAHHATALRAGDLEQVLKDFNAESRLMTIDRTYTGPDEIREFYVKLIEQFPDADWNARRNFSEDVLFANWTATSAKFHVSDGTDTFVFRDGMIHLQTVHATVEPL